MEQIIIVWMCEEDLMLQVLFNKASKGRIKAVFQRKFSLAGLFLLQ